MNPTQKRERLFAIYEEFERDAALWKKDALCGPGCSFCCTHFGSVDVTTLEALNVHDFMMRVCRMMSVTVAHRGILMRTASSD